MSIEILSNVLKKLRVKSGLVGESKSLFGPWRVGFFYSKEEPAFVFDLYYNDRKKSIRLLPDDVETRGKSNWRTNNTYRLTPSGVARIAECAWSVIERTTAAQAKANAEKKSDGAKKASAGKKKNAN